MLLVIDDVWAWDHAKTFVEEVAFPGCVRLCTTRDATIARRFAGRETWVGELSEEEAEKLLAARCPAALAADPEGVRALIKAVGGLPLGLSLIAGRLLGRQGNARWMRKAVEVLKETMARLRRWRGTSGGGRWGRSWR